MYLYFRDFRNINDFTNLKKKKSMKIYEISDMNLPIAFLLDDD